MARIAIAGFMHETNTFAPIKATWQDFVRAEGMPGLTQGEAMLTVFPPLNVATGGFIKTAQNLGHELLPIAWADTVPSAHVTTEAFENMAEIILQGIRKQAIDAIYLDLHGAMVTEQLQDAEGELLRRIRARLDSELPIVASLDLHSNTTQAMLDLCDGLVAYRTYPHVDMNATGARAAHYLHDLFKNKPLAKARRALPFLMPLTGQCTLMQPMQGVYQELERLEQTLDGVRLISFTPGFPPADIWDCGPVICAYADTQVQADNAVNELYQYILTREAEFIVPMLSPYEAVRQALHNSSDKPIVLADIQDNCGAGGTSDTTGLLTEMVRQKAQKCVLGVLVDGAAAQAAHEAEPGARLNLAVGGKLFQGDPPLQADWQVIGLSDGQFLCTGAFYRGVTANLGPMAVLRSGGVSVVVSTHRMQAADQAMFRHIGINLEQYKILGLKSAVHFRADFTDIAAKIINVEAPGAFIDRPERLPYQNLRPSVRLCPKGPTYPGPILA